MVSSMMIENDELLRADIPDTLLVKTYDSTGDEDGNNRGFLLFFINKNGDPNCIARPEDGATRTALMETVDSFMLEDESFLVNKLDSQIPTMILDRLYQSTGNRRGGNKGYLLFYIEDGKLKYMHECGTQATYYALKSVVNDYRELVIPTEEL